MSNVRPKLGAEERKQTLWEERVGDAGLRENEKMREALKCRLV